MGYPLQSDAEKMYRRLSHLNSNKDSHKRYKRDGFLGLFGQKVDLLDQYEKRLEDLRDNVRMEQASLAVKVCPIPVSIYFYNWLTFLTYGENLHILQKVVCLVNPLENSLVIDKNVDTKWKAS